MPENRRSPDASRAAAGALPYIGRRKELRALASLLARGNRALILGPRGIGKTRLVMEASAACGLAPVSLSASGPLRGLLEELFLEITSETIPPASVHMLPGQALQARVLRELQARPRWLWIDDPAPAGPRLHRFLQRVLWTKGCGLAVCAESRRQLGWLARLLWDPREQIVLEPLARSRSAELLDEAMNAFGVEARGAAADFREQVLEAAAGNPGRIVTLCRLAAQPQYWHGGHLMFAPLWIDTLTQLA